MIGDREMEIDKLIKMSREDLWKVDLDEFINEWRFQLEDEAKRQKKIARMDRRASQKLNIGGAGGKKRKAGSHDSDDSDFGLGISKAQKKAATKQAKIKSAGLLSEPLAKANQPKPKVPKKAMTAPTAAKEVKSEKNTQDDVWMSLSRTDGGASEPPVAPIFQKTKAAATASKPLPPKKMETDEDDNDEDDIVISKPGARNRRAAASKPVSYGIDSESDDMGDDMLFDVGKMVKGINGGTSTTESNSRPLFSATVSSSTRPSSSHGLPKKSSSAGAMDVDVDADDTDYSRLAPPTTKKGPAVTAKQTVLSDEDDDDSFDAMMAAAVAAPKAAPKPAPKATKPPVPKVSAKPAATKASKEAAAKKVPAAVPTKKPLPLSPAAKAYAAKQAKKTKAPVLDDDDSEDEVENLANEIMDDDDDDDEDEVMAAPARAAAAGGGGRGRPARRAAASAPTKKNWVVASGSESESAEEEEEEEEEESAMFDGEESDDY